MKLKYYLRGLGIGIIVTALLMGYSDSKAADHKAENQIVKATTESEPETEAVTEEAVLEEPETDYLYVTEENSIDLQITEAQNEACSEKETEETESFHTDQITETQSETEEIMTEKETEEEELIPSVFVGEDAQECYLLQIVKGDGSGTVARKLQNAGIIENAAEFDAYLMQHGYDKKISVGTVEIPQGATWLEIAQMISGR